MRILKIITAISILLLTTTVNADISTEQYYQLLDNSNAVQITDLKLKELESSNQEFVLFIGRPSCQYCRKFVPKLEKANRKIRQKIYYIDSQRYLNSYLSEFRQKYSVKFVPTLIKIKDKHITAKTKNGSKTTINEIKNILK